MKHSIQHVAEYLEPTHEWCGACRHRGEEHDLNNRCLVCSCPQFSSDKMLSLQVALRLAGLAEWKDVERAPQARPPGDSILHSVIVEVDDRGCGGTHLTGHGYCQALEAELHGRGYKIVKT